MSASLVGSEMCIRDSAATSPRRLIVLSARPASAAPPLSCPGLLCAGCSAASSSQVALCPSVGLSCGA
eukprot:5527610-Alexandrium_andersonii.AAC.1